MLNSMAVFASAFTMMDVLVFFGSFLGVVAIDLLMHKNDKDGVSFGHAAKWTVIWVLCALAFGGYVYMTRGLEMASLFVTGYALEWSLSIDNMFAFLLIFKSFGLAGRDKEHLEFKILVWGILGAIFFRIAFLSVGAFAVNLSPMVMLAFAAVIAFTVYKMWTSGGDDDEQVDYTNHWSVRFIRKIAKINPSIESGRFFHNGVTPLFLCLVCIEACDILFAFDSMPVIIAVVQNPFIMITASLWAVAGLRAGYFMLKAAEDMFWALDKAIMFLLMYIAVKLAMSPWYHIPSLVSLGVTLAFLTGGVLWSLLVKNPDAAADKTK